MFGLHTSHISQLHFINSEFFNAQPTNRRSPTHLGHGSGTPSQHSIHSQSTQHKQHPSWFLLEYYSITPPHSLFTVLHNDQPLII